MNDTAPENESGYLTTKEVAAFLRVKERRVYELVRQEAIPCTRVTGKWLFPRREVERWLAESLRGEALADPPPVIAGSQDPLLDWAVRQSGCGLALLPGGSLDGLARFSGGQAMVAGLHLHDAESDSFNVAAVEAALPTTAGLVLMEWAWRRQGLILAPGNPKGVEGLKDLAGAGLTVMPRQEGAGAQRLFLELLAAEGLSPDDLKLTPETARSESDLGLAVLEGRAEAGFAVEAVARPLKLAFLPLARERYDLLIRRRHFFEPPFQALLDFARSEAFQARATAMGGYEIEGLGSVRLNGA